MDGRRLIAVLNGAKGPAVLFTGGVHGDEYEGQIAISRLARRLDPQSVRGKVILLPAVDLPAALAGRRMCPIDGRDSTAASDRGSFCQMLAPSDSVLLPQVEISVDVHAAGNAMEAALSSTMHWVEDPAVVRRTKELAENFSAPYNVVFWGVDEGGTMASAAERRGVLAISSEIGGYGRVSVEGVRVAERGLDNVLKWLGMIEGKPDTSQHDGSKGTRHMEVRDQKAYVFAPSEGLSNRCISQARVQGSAQDPAFIKVGPPTVPIEFAPARSGWRLARSGAQGRLTWRRDPAVSAAARRTGECGNVWRRLVVHSVLNENFLHSRSAATAGL
jgi:N-alpha-acetyl-L-2,4-diaminobutyrate deacetylase